MAGLQCQSDSSYDPYNVYGLEREVILGLAYDQPVELHSAMMRKRLYAVSSGTAYKAIPMAGFSVFHRAMRLAGGRQ